MRRDPEETLWDPPWRMRDWIMLWILSGVERLFRWIATACTYGSVGLMCGPIADLERRRPLSRAERTFEETRRALERIYMQAFERAVLVVWARSVCGPADPFDVGDITHEPPADEPPADAPRVLH